MWSAKENRLLRLILDELVPPSEDGRVPGAGTLGIAEFFVSADTYAVDPVGSVRKVLSAVEARSSGFDDLACDDRVALLLQVEAEEADAFATLVRLTYMGYYSRADTRPLFGVGAQPVHPDGYPVMSEDDALMQSLTAPVKVRGRLYRD